MIRDIRKEQKVTLPGVERQAVVFAFEAGRQHPADGNNRRVVWELHLPATDEGHLVPDLWLETTRCGVDNLGPDWGIPSLFSDVVGYPIVFKTRFIFSNAYGPTYAEAYAAAEQDVEKALRPLLEALQQRQAG